MITRTDPVIARTDLVINEMITRTDPVIKFLLFDSNFFVTLQRHTLTQGMEYINCCNNMNQEPIPMISVDKMITRTDPVIALQKIGDNLRPFDF